MRAFEIAVLGAAMVFASACSNSDQTDRVSQAQALVTASVGDAGAAVVDARAPLVGATNAPVTGGALLAIPSVGGSGRPAPSTAQLALGDPTELTTLRGIAMASASAAGVASPKTIDAVAASDHQIAEYALCGAVVNDHAPVYVIKMTGGPFTARRHPPGQAAPQGNVLTLTVDATTHRVTDVGYVNVEPDLTTIGSFTANLSTAVDAGAE